MCELVPVVVGVVLIHPVNEPCAYAVMAELTVCEVSAQFASMRCVSSTHDILPAVP